MKKVLNFISTFVLLITFCNAQVSTFNLAFGYSNGNGTWLDGALDVVTLHDSSICVWSPSQGLQALQQKIVITKFSKDGSQTFQKAYGEDSVFYIPGQFGTLIKTFDGGYAFAGVEFFTSEAWGSFWKFDSNADSILKLNFGSVNNFDTIDNFYDLVQLVDSGFIMVGFTTLNQDSFPQSQWNTDVYLVRIDYNGNLLWQKRFGTANRDLVFHLESFDNNHIIGAGFKQKFYDTVDTPWVFVADLEGNIVKERSFPDPPYNCYTLIGPRLFPSIDGNFFFTGCLNGAIVNNGYETPEYIAKMDTNLNFIWERDFNTANLIYIYHAEQNEDSTIMVVGVQVDSITGREWGWVSKLDNNGNTVWDNLYKKGNSDFNYLYDIDQTYDCGFVVSGSTLAPDQQSWLLKMDKYGCINPVCDTSASSCGIGFPTSNSQSQSVSTMQLDVSIYPNPASDQLSVFYNLPQGSNTAQLTIYNLNGSKVHEEKLYRALHEVSVDVSALAGGVYVCEIKTPKEILTKKLLVAR